MSDKELFDKYAEICDYRVKRLVDIGESTLFMALRDLLRRGSRLSAARDANRIGPDTPDCDMVICPQCTSQFRAIPVNVQRELAEAERDAARYRWIRSPKSGQLGWWHIKYNDDPAKIDAAIDAAMPTATVTAAEGER